MRDQAPVLPSGVPMVGREAELDHVRTVVTGQQRSVIIAGPTGVGKSRLAAEALEACGAAGFSVRRVTATRSSSRIPLGVFAPWSPVDPVERGGPVDRAALLRRCAESLTDHAGPGPLVLGVDDAHLLDDMSATLVHQVATTGAALVIASVRSGEPLPDAVLALWKGRHAERIELDVLGVEAVGEVLAGALGGPPDDATVAQIARRSGGNMLFLVELVAGALAEGVLRRESGCWRLVGELHPSEALIDLVESRLDGLCEAERHLLEVVALGEPLGVAELARLGDEAVAERLERKALLTTDLESSRLVIRLSHPVYGDVLRHRIPSLRARAIARALAASFEEAGGSGDDDLLRIASWRLIGGEAEPETMLAAAVKARWRFDFPLAERFARNAVEGGAGTAAVVLAAQLAGLQGRTAQADHELARLATEASTPHERGRIVLTRLDNTIIYAGSIDEGLRIAEQAEGEVPDGDLRDEIVARRCALLLAKEGPQRAAESLRVLLSRATGRALAWACMPSAYSLGRMGRIAEALDVSRRGRAAQDALAAPTDWYPFMHHFYEVEALHHAGRFAEGEELASCCYREGVENGSLEQQAMFSWQLAKTVLDRGHVDEAERRVRLAFGLYRRLDRGQFVDFCCIYRAQALALAGRYDDACAALRDLDHLGVGPSFFMGVDLTVTRGWVRVAGGHDRRGMEHFLDAAAEGERIGDHVGALAALHSVARIGYPARAAERVDDVASAVEGVLGRARVAHVHGLADGDARALEAASESFEAMGADLLAAEAAADAAVCWSRSDDRRHRAAAERRAETLAQRCHGASTPSLRAIGTRAQLTPAEREAAALAATGMSNRDIAAELVVSIRTVENRLQSVYQKLGVRSRRALAGELAGSGPVSRTKPITRTRTARVCAGDGAGGHEVSST